MEGRNDTASIMRNMQKQQISKLHLANV